MNKIVIEIDSNVDMDKVVTFISEKCRQENILFRISADDRLSPEKIEELTTFIKNVKE